MNGDAVPPADVLHQALLELGLGPQGTVAKTLQAYNQNRLSGHDVHLLLQSLSWQSPTLCRFYLVEHNTLQEIADRNCAEMEHLSDEDMIVLMEQQSLPDHNNCGRLRQPTSSDDGATLQMEAPFESGFLSLSITDH